MALDGITCSCLAKELNGELSGQRIDKIFMPDKHTCILMIRTRSGVKKLLISFDPSFPRAGFSETDRDNPAMPPPFCMLLRKYLSGAFIESVTDPDYERIIEFHITGTDELHDSKHYRLIAELMGRFSNLILVNQSGKIIDAAIHVDYSVSRIREVMPARIYEYPQSQNKILPDEALKITEEGRLPLTKEASGRPVEKALVESIKGLSPLLARQLCHKARIDGRLTAAMLPEEDVDSLNKECRDFLSKLIGGTFRPGVYFGPDGEPADYSVMELEGFDDSKFCGSISECIDLFYSSKDKSMALDAKKHRLDQITSAALSRLMKKKEVHEKDYAEGAKADKYKSCGDLILTYKYMIEPSADSVTLMNYEEDPPREIEVTLDPSLDASGNAQDYYRRFRKAKRKFEMAEEYLKEDELAISYIRSLRTAIDSATCDEDLDALNEEIRSEITGDSKSKADRKGPVQNAGNPNRMVGVAKSGKASSRALREAAKLAKQRQVKQSRQTKEVSFRKYTSSDGYEILCGRNNIQNDKLTFSVASKTDWWFHIKGLPGTHVILKTRPDEDMPSDTAVIEAAQLAAFFSRNTIVEEHLEGKGTKAGSIKAEVDYCPVSHVKKIPGAKPGMVIYKEYYSITVDAKEPN